MKRIDIDQGKDKWRLLWTRQWFHNMTGFPV